MSEPTAEGITKNIAAGGWEMLASKVGNPAREVGMSEKTKALNVAYAHVFSSAEGKMVLEDLLDQTLRRATWDGNRSLEQAATYGLMREGQNSIVACIMQRMEAGKKAP